MMLINVYVVLNVWERLKMGIVLCVVIILVVIVKWKVKVMKILMIFMKKIFCMMKKMKIVEDFLDNVFLIFIFIW